MKTSLSALAISLALLVSSCGDSISYDNEIAFLDRETSNDYYQEMDTLLNRMTHGHLNEKGTNVFGSACFIFEGLDSTGRSTGTEYKVTIADPMFTGTGMYGLDISEFSHVDTTEKVLERRLGIMFRSSKRSMAWVEKRLVQSSSELGGAYEKVDPRQFVAWFDEMTSAILVTAQDAPLN